MEIVNKLVELKLIDVLYTQDGKEYITPQNLSKEIRDELFVHGGKYEDVVLYLIYRYILRILQELGLPNIALTNAPKPTSKGDIKEWVR